MRLGEHHFQKKVFSDLDAVFASFSEKEFLQLGDRKRSEKVNRALLELIRKEAEPAFLLSAVLNFVEEIDRKNILHHYTFTSFELWLNQYSDLTDEENLRIRAKIVGKFVPRETYQNLFPIGMGKMHEGTHFVTAHKSPDLDTTIASFWGWVDAFGARVGNSLHIWNLPEGPPASQIEIKLFFRDVFGSSVFTHLPKIRTILTITANDLMHQKNMVYKTTEETTLKVHHKRTENAIVVVDREGYYLGDWRSVDVEGVRRITMLLHGCLRWFENNINYRLIALFSKDDLTFDAFLRSVDEMFDQYISKSEPVSEYSDQEKELFHAFLIKILGMQKGMQSSFKELGKALVKQRIAKEDLIDSMISSIREQNLFEKDGKLITKRSLIFSYLETIMRSLQKTVQSIRALMESLEIALKVKSSVLNYTPHFVTVRADVQEIRSKMNAYQYLTVTYPDEGKFFPMGIIHAQYLRKPVLGTVSLRDFCNREEMTIPSYLQVISVIDHHKSYLQTTSPPLAIIGDAQSSNALVAEQAFLINDKFSFGNLSKEETKAQVEALEGKNKTLSEYRILQQLYTYASNSQREDGFYIHPEREILEYMHFLYGILDDTDLLSKVSARDVECTVFLLNRLKSLITKKQTEIIAIDDIAKDDEYAEKAAKKILQNEDMYSLYKKVYEHREKEVERNIILAAKKEPSSIFADTKELNGCCRIGQTKRFGNNVASFEKHKEELLEFWLENAESIQIQKPEFDLHLHMVSTIVSADEVYKGNTENYAHKDELWIWTASTDIAIEHLKLFLASFQNSPDIKHNDLSIEFLGSNAKELDQIFHESFFPIKRILRKEKKNLPMAILYYNAGSLNSRKAMISPYLPSLPE